MNLALRAISDNDLDFLYRVYAGTRQAELAVLDWTQAQKEQFLRFQFQAQHSHYQEHYRDACYDLILLDGSPVGRLYVDRWPDEIRIVDIALLPEQRGRGIGSIFLRRLLDEGQAKGQPVSIHVERNNPALRLYTRLGFEQVDEHGVYLLMEWRPQDVEQVQASGAVLRSALQDG